VDIDQKWGNDLNEAKIEKCLHIYFEGRVQGVGFRYTATYLARKHQIKGWVMNLPDGRVELIGQGYSQQLDKFLQELKNEFSGYITKMNLQKIPPSSELHNFQIRFYSY